MAVHWPLGHHQSQPGSFVGGAGCMAWPFLRIYILSSRYGSRMVISSGEEGDVAGRRWGSWGRSFLRLGVEVEPEI